MWPGRGSLCAAFLCSIPPDGKTAQVLFAGAENTSREGRGIEQRVHALPVRSPGLAQNGHDHVSESRMSGATSSATKAPPNTTAVLSGTEQADSITMTKRALENILTPSEEPDFRLSENEGNGSKPILIITSEGRGERQLPPEEEEEQDIGPGEYIEGMEEDWTKHASIRALPGAILDNARSVFAEISDDILTRWGHKYANTSLFSGGMRFSDGGMVVENKFLNAVLEQEGFVAAFTGVSTTAAHDCLFEQSFPVILNKTMSRLLAAGGVQFEAINVAMGNTRVAPYSYCVDAHAGLNADIIAWDMSLMVATTKCGVAASGVELFVRSASALAKRPAVLLTDAFPDQELCTNGHMRLVERLNEGLTGDCVPGRDLFEVYRDFGLHQISPRSLVPHITCGDDVFARARLFNSTEKDYPAPVRWHAGPAGHLLLGDMLFMHYAVVVLNALQRLDDVSPGITTTDLRQYDRDRRNHLREALGLEPTEDVTPHRGGGSTTPKVSDEMYMDGSGTAMTYAGGGGEGILPPPVWCKGWRFCDWAGRYRCANTYFPLAGAEGSRLLDMMSERTPVALNLNRSDSFVEPSPGRWAVTLNEESKHIKDYLKMPSPDGFHHPIDMKWVLVGDKDSGPIEFEFETLRAPPAEGERWGRAAAIVDEAEEKGYEGAAAANSGDTTHLDYNGTDDSTATATSRLGQDAIFDSRITLCKPDFIDRVPFNESSEVRVSVDGVQVSAEELVQYGLHPQSCFLLDAEVGVGRHTVKVEPLRAGEPYVAVSHLLYPA